MIFSAVKSFATIKKILIVTSTTVILNRGQLMFGYALAPNKNLYLLAVI